jgi:UMF1 family MFS transporter
VSAARVTPRDRDPWRRVRAWASYDWANHGYLTVTATTFFPPYFVAIAAPAFLASGGVGNLQALARNAASDVFAVVVAAALATAAVLSPIVGTLADIAGTRKRLLLAVTGVGAVVAGSMVVVTHGRWQLALALYFVTQVAINVALGLNSSLLQHVAPPGGLDRASSLGYAMGYVGGGVLLAGATAVFLGADNLGIGRDEAVRGIFLVVGIWWIAFSLPLAVGVPEPPATPLASGATGHALGDALRRLRHTLADMRRYRALLTMLAAFWLYMEGVGAIILLATAYGAAIGLDTAGLVGTLLLTQLVAFPYALAFGRLPDRSWRWRNAVVAMLLWTAVTLPALGAWANVRGGAGAGATLAILLADQVLGLALAMTVLGPVAAPLARRLDARGCIVLGLAIYTVIPIWGFLLRTQAEFFMIGLLVGTVQGGTQALSRSIYASLVPPPKSGEFFGIYGLAEKFAGILGPLLYGIVGSITHNPRASILSVAIFFVLGALVLMRVDIAGGQAAAAAETAEIVAGLATD